MISNHRPDNTKIIMLGMILLFLIILAGGYAACGTPERYCVTNYSSMDATTKCLDAIKGVAP